jgi:pseudouridine synthase
MRLQKLIALTTELSRRTAEQAIAKGLVTVNGTVVTVMGTTVDPLKDKVYFKGRPLRTPERFYYLAFYKPRRVLVTKNDPEGRPTIWEYLESWKGKLNSAGRLDFESEGLILLTNDGEMLNALTHPRHEIFKIYEAKVRGVPAKETLDNLKNGVRLDDGKTLPAEVRVLSVKESNAWIEISIREGRYRQIRRMCEAVGHDVLKLKRVSVGPIRLARMKPGEWRFLSQKEVSSLREALATKQSHGIAKLSSR